jgi:hypothetical protein
MQTRRALALSLVAALESTAALAQGKISFQTDSLHLVYYGSMPPADAALAGQGVDSAHMPSGVTLVADLYVGTSSSVLSFVSSTTFNATPGRWNSMSVVVPGIPGDTSVFVVTQIRDQAFAPPITFHGNYFGTYYAYSQEFTFTLGASIVYPVMWGTNGNWAAGTFTFPLDQYGAGARGAIQIDIIPEPAMLYFAAFGVVLATTLARCKRVRRI